MRRFLMNLSLLALVTAPLAAHAASFDQLTYTMTSGTPGVYTFLLPANPTVFSTDGVNYISMAVAESTNGGPSVSDTVLLLTDAGGDGLFDSTQNLQFGSPLLLIGNNVTTPQIFTGTGTGVASIKGGLNQTFSFVSAPVVGTAAATPEPSSLVLLGTGAIGLFGAFRRRFAA